MYGSTGRSLTQRLCILFLQCIFLIFVYWFLFAGGNVSFGMDAGTLERKTLLFVCCLVIFVRMNVMVFYLLRRGIMWQEAFSVSIAFGVYYIGFSLLGGTVALSVDVLDYLAVAVFLIGSGINTISEVLRFLWKKDKTNQGKLYTGGLFTYSMHINYFGDFLWVCGMALLTRNAWSILIPAVLFLFFVFYNIPVHDKYLRNKYGEAFHQYEKRTKKFIPFIY